MRWDILARRLENAGDERAVAAALDVAETDLVITGSCQAALLFGSASPDLLAADVRTLAEVLVAQYTPDEPRSALAELARDEPLEPAVRPYQQGYDLAEELLAELDTDATWIDVEEIVRNLGVTILSRKIEDAGVRGCSVRGPRHRPTIVYNTHPVYARRDVYRRFTLAHELCHLLYDAAYGQRLAMVSGPWAPLRVEQRANAFAAMFLMPPHLVREAISGLADPVHDPRSVALIAGRLRVGTEAAINHLANLTLISEAEREDLRRARDEREYRS